MGPVALLTVLTISVICSASALFSIRPCLGRLKLAALTYLDRAPQIPENSHLICLQPLSSPLLSLYPPRT